jgi:hypothetical protein
LKKAFTLFLLFLFLFNILGYYFIFEIFKYHAKKEIQNAALSGSASLTIFRIVDLLHDPQFQRVESKEIRYKGSLYDVIKEVQSGRSTILYCIHDKKEEDLLAAMNAVNKNKFLLSLWQHLIKIAIPPIDMTLSNPFSVKVVFPQTTVSLRFTAASKWSPPPESA